MEEEVETGGSQEGDGEGQGRIERQRRRWRGEEPSGDVCRIAQAHLLGHQNGQQILCFFFHHQIEIKIICNHFSASLLF